MDLNLNVMKCAWNWRHPLRRIKEFFINLKFARQRVKNGYCDMDVWEMDKWLLGILPCMLRQLEVKGVAYPGLEPFETPVKWHNWLREMACKIEELQYDNWEKKNEWNEEFYAFGKKVPDNVRVEWFKRAKELKIERNQKLIEVFNELATHLDCLWD